MTKKSFRAIIAIALIMLTGGAFAQDTETDNHLLTITITEFAILDIESSGDNDITLLAEEPDEAGDPIELDDTNDDLWLNYSSIVASGSTNKVTVAASTVVDGIDIKLEVEAYSGDGEGTHGAPTGEVTLTTSAQDIITGIGSCYTDDGASSGHQLNYSFDFETGEYGSIIADEHEVTVTYTIVAAN